MSFITFQCYACGQMLKVGADKSGRKAKCHKCGTLLTIPIASAPPGAGPASATGAGPVSGVGPVSSSRAKPPPLPPASTIRRAPPTDQVSAAPGQPTPVAPLDDDLDDERPRRRPRDDEDYEGEEDRGSRSRKAERAAWWRARLGLLLVFIGACVLAGAFALEAVGYLLLSIEVIRGLTGSAPRVGGGSDTAISILMRIAVLLEAGAAVTAIVGYVFCILGPRERGALGLSIATTAVASIYLLILLVFKMPLFFGSLFAGPGAFSMGWFSLWFFLFLLQLLFAAQLILFPFYLRSVALLRKSRTDAQASVMTMIMGCVYAGVRLLTFIFFCIVLQAAFAATIGFGPREPPRAMIWITLVFLWLGVFAFVALLIFYLLRVWKTRALID